MKEILNVSVSYLINCRSHKQGLYTVQECRELMDGEQEHKTGGDLLLLGDLPRVVEEEDKRLLMPASDGCFRFMVDVERLSTRREEERQTREEGFTLEVG